MMVLHTGGMGSRGREAASGGVHHTFALATSKGAREGAPVLQIMQHYALINVMLLAQGRK